MAQTCRVSKRSYALAPKHGNPPISDWGLFTASLIAILPLEKHPSRVYHMMAIHPNSRDRVFFRTDYMGQCIEADKDDLIRKLAEGALPLRVDVRYYRPK